MVSARTWIAGLLACCAATLSMNAGVVRASEPEVDIGEELVKDYEIVSLLKEDDSVVTVVRRNQVMFMLYDQTIIGAEFDDPFLRKQAAYPGFAIMQCAAYLDRKITHAAQIGLGIGTVPSFLREQGIRTDVIEISDAVVRQAANYFQYERCEINDPEDCDSGTTYVTDGLAFIDNAPAEPVYDLFVIDVYTGWNPLAFFVKEVFDAVHTKWLKQRGVLVLNFVGFISGEHVAVPKSIYRTLRTGFAHVKCFREIENPEASGINIVYFASDEPFTFNVPTDGEYVSPPENTYYYIVKNFQKWEIFTDSVDENVEVEVMQGLDAEEVSFEATGTPAHAITSAQVLTKEDHGQVIFKATHAFTQEHMRVRVVEQFPEAYWKEVGITV